MKPDFTSWPYEHLINIKEQLEELLKSGDKFGDLRNDLKAVNEEIAARTFVLVGVLGGRVVKEYGRWRSAELCKDQASRMNLPVGVPFDFSGQPFETVIRKLS